MDILNEKDIKLITQSGKILKNTLSILSKNIKPGISGKHLDELAEENIRSYGAKPSFKNYLSGGSNPFPASLCVSINEYIVHGIPRRDQIIKEGDVVKLDLGVNYKGLCTDSAVTVIAGNDKDSLKSRLVDVTRESLTEAIKVAKPGNKTGDIGNIIENYVVSRGFNVVKTLVGHGIGHNPHDEPQVPNFGKQGTGVALIENTAIAIEPMVVVGRNDLKTDMKDGWSIKTIDKSLTAHFEHTVLITKNGCKVVT